MGGCVRGVACLLWAALAGGCGSRPLPPDAMAPGDTRIDEPDRDTRPLDAARDGDALADGGCPLPPDAVTRPECSNGIDDDGDGRVDALDPDCTSPYGTSESRLAIGVMGNFDICGRDCGFDNDPGQGND